MTTWAGNLVRMARTERQLSQRELAKRAGTSQAAIDAIESGNRSPSLETLARIVRAAGLDLRIRLEAYDGHDEWLQAYEAALPRKVVSDRRRRDAALASSARRRSS